MDARMQESMSCPLFHPLIVFFLCFVQFLLLETKAAEPPLIIVKCMRCHRGKAKDPPLCSCPSFQTLALPPTPLLSPPQMLLRTLPACAKFSRLPQFCLLLLTLIQSHSFPCLAYNNYNDNNKSNTCCNYSPTLSSMSVLMFI